MSDSGNQGQPEAETVFLEETYHETFALVREAIDYLEGPGAEAPEALDSRSSVVFSVESMRLTSRLISMAAWLLQRIAEARGESPVNGKSDQGSNPLKLGEMIRMEPTDLHLLPPKLLILIDRTRNLFERIERIERFSLVAENVNPVHGLLTRLARSQDDSETS